VKLGLAEQPLGKMRDLKRKAKIGELIGDNKWLFSIVLAAFDFGCFSIKSVGLLSS
jgi:hypothetical protein